MTLNSENVLIWVNKMLSLDSSFLLPQEKSILGDNVEAKYENKHFPYKEVHRHIHVYCIRTYTWMYISMLNI